ncbi:DUF6602 domain-containing protein [Streptomyces sp. NPDC057681]|uniref:DUF6602 domain-containing protein n=1 Tax=Streptomyces sp. NPDC057681 TaxID=3346209 RepID=UPI0036BEDB15
MRADFEQSKVFSHNGEAGTSREVLVQNFLSSCLPAHVQAIHNAEIIASDGGLSRQCDVVVVNRETPPLTSLGGYRVIPNECVYGLVEVKTNLTRADLLDACEKIRNARCLSKTAYRRVPGPIARTTHAYGRTYDHFPTSGIVVAFGGLHLKTLGDHLVEWCKGRPVTEWPDSVWVLGKGALQWRSAANGLLDRTPSPGASLVQVDAPDGEDVLLPLALHLNIHFSEAWMHPLDLVPYAGKSVLGTAVREWTVS